MGSEVLHILAIMISPATRLLLPSCTIFWLFALAACELAHPIEQNTQEPDPNYLTIDTISYAAIGDTLHALVLQPVHEPQDTTPLPVLFLLHGYGGNHLSWSQQVPELTELVRQYPFLVVCPQADNSWYFDNPIRQDQNYAAAIGRQLPSLIDSLYPTVGHSSGRFITGLSMGGHGALYLAYRFPNTFGAVGSMSGGLDLLPFADRFELTDLLGSPEKYSERWQAHNVLDLLDRWPNPPPTLLIDCGSEDFFLEANQRAHRKLLALGIPHHYVIRPGTHNWIYWRHVLPDHMRFFARVWYQRESNYPAGLEGVK